MMQNWKTISGTMVQMWKTISRKKPQNWKTILKIRIRNANENLPNKLLEIVLYF